MPRPSRALTLLLLLDHVDDQLHDLVDPARLRLTVGEGLAPVGDVQLYRVELGGRDDVEVTKGIATDARVRVEMPRSFFNVMAKDCLLYTSPSPRDS